MAPPIRVAICAKGISCMRLEAVRMATSPVPPMPLWVPTTMAASIGCILTLRPTKKPTVIKVATVATMVRMVGRLKASTTFCHGVTTMPMANSKG
ncbi:hypothetical protein D3C78_1711680 [compost metagenome]